MHTKTFVLNGLGSLLVLTRDANSKVFQAEVVFQIPNNRCQHVCQRKRSPCKPCGGEAIVHKNLGKQRQSVFIFMVTSVAASSFVLFHAARSLELLDLRMMLPRTRVGNFGVKNISLSDGIYEIFLTQKNANIFRFTVPYLVRSEHQTSIQKTKV